MSLCSRLATQKTSQLVSINQNETHDWLKEQNHVYIIMQQRNKIIEHSQIYSSSEVFKNGLVLLMG